LAGGQAPLQPAPRLGGQIARHDLAALEMPGATGVLSTQSFRNPRGRFNLLARLKPLARFDLRDPCNLSPGRRRQRLLQTGTQGERQRPRPV
jgi:hypothetical protein